LNIYTKKFIAVIIAFFAISFINAQQITGVWKGTIGNRRAEIKIIKSGDSLTGTAYYYASANNYKRYSIKGYFDPKTNDAIWWDDILLEDKSKSNALSGNAPQALMNIADFNCPGEDEMRLDGNSFFVDEKKKVPGTLNLQKKGSPLFPDEWDWVINNYTAGANDPYIIDSVAKLNRELHDVVVAGKKPAPQKAFNHDRDNPVINTPVVVPPKEEKKIVAVKQLTPEEKFTSRNKILQQVIPIKGDSIELRFYDNGEIDGDSIAFFLNNKIIFKHVMITDKAYTIKFAVKDLEEDNEAVMVAENLGSIPPNTALMIAIVGDKRYEAHLYADENSSALIRFIKEEKIQPTGK
jgi:hypothetical protein